MQWRSHDLSVRFDDIATLADSSVWLKYGNTTVLATVVMDEKPKNHIDFTPLSVFYLEKAYAARRIPGGFIKREGKNQDHEVLISRLIDRSLRPLIVSGLQNEVQIIIQVLSFDHEVGSIIPSLIAASIAIQRSPVPLKVKTSLAGCQVALLNGEIIINPSVEQLKKTTADFIVVGNEKKLMMIEGGANELPSKTLSLMVKEAVKAYQPVIEMMRKLPPKTSSKKPTIIKVTALAKKIVSQKENLIKDALSLKMKHQRNHTLNVLKGDFIKQNPKIPPLAIQKAFEEIERELIIKKIIEINKRMDGRGLEEIRPIKIENKILPHLHGSSLFTRGETQVLGVLTLGKAEEKQSADELSGFKSYNFMFHYNFMPFCVGTADKMGPPSRREIGHGHIAYRALFPMLPDQLYAYRIVSEVLSSNGSSSMASVCAGSLSLMDAGIRIKRHVAGVALGLMKYKNQMKILVDILGDEDHLGAMDLKICGTEKGINALQMDVDLQEGISLTTFNQAIKTGCKAVLNILEIMNKVKRYPSKTLPEGVLKLEALVVDKNKARQVFGKKSEELREIEKETETRIDSQDLGRIVISSTAFKNIFAAKKMIYQSLKEFDKEQFYKATVVSTENNDFIITVKNLYLGELIFDKKIKRLKKDDKIKVEYVKLNHHGNPEFKFLERITEKSI